MEHIALSPAKVNLYLKILSRRPDGYHNIESIVDPISIYDVIHIKEIDDGRIVVRDNRGVLPDGRGNTIFRAVELLRGRYRIGKGVEIFVEKNIPIGSGLGGPSSNAATVLRELAGIWGLNVKEDELRDLGKAIGADVPLFLYGRPCIMRGIGDIISPVELPGMWYIVVYPDVEIPTKEVYNRIKIVLTNTENDIKLLGKFNTLYDIADILENDLEKVGIIMCPQIKTIKKTLKESGAVGSLMSGSGSSVFGIFKTERDAEKALAHVKDLGEVFLAHSL
ncbi:MAG: 4-diphosphocytidyl-2-C-methyl-D-erythritol kinase [Syntrophorhabdus sp. PtaU1.Bin058]|nr:MAG: 4-diphosphocytidyl-2-C-methyl-D-erythritol kinase [Syntrophorhabdus sp. PtaU1.Bin058]